jgi:hypothetical protein
MVFPQHSGFKPEKGMVMGYFYCVGLARMATVISIIDRVGDVVDLVLRR